MGPILGTRGLFPKLWLGNKRRAPEVAAEFVMWFWSPGEDQGGEKRDDVGTCRIVELCFWGQTNERP